MLNDVNTNAPSTGDLHLASPHDENLDFFCGIDEWMGLFVSSLMCKSWISVEVFPQLF